jgi:hypothetical protein
MNKTLENGRYTEGSFFFSSTFYSLRLTRRNLQTLKLKLFKRGVQTYSNAPC